MSLPREISAGLGWCGAIVPVGFAAANQLPPITPAKFMIGYIACTALAVFVLWRLCRWKINKDARRDDHRH